MATKPKRPGQALAKEQLEADIIVLADLRAQAGVLDEQIKEVQERITNSPYWSSATKSFSVTSPKGFVYKALYQQTPRRTINEDKLKRKVGPSIWRRITTLTLDRKKAEALVAAGEIDPVDYADCIEETLSAPFVKVTTSKAVK